MLVQAGLYLNNDSLSRKRFLQLSYKHGKQLHAENDPSLDHALNIKGLMSRSLSDLVLVQVNDQDFLVCQDQPVPLKYRLSQLQRYK
ncbi:hypothetical protein A3N42_23545 [Klebsiella aerogenes]|nr:hypothetical protein A3N42_23545 [Klebsiella aerogenes]